MDAKAIEARKKYFKDWRKNNKDKIRSSNERYWTKRAERESQRQGQDLQHSKA